MSKFDKCFFVHEGIKISLYLALNNNRGKKVKHMKNEYETHEKTHVKRLSNTCKKTHVKSKNDSVFVPVSATKS